MALQEDLEKQGIKYLQFQFTNYLGEIKAVEMPTSSAEKAFSEGVGVDGSSVRLAPTRASDIRLAPDPETVRALPWAPGVASVVCDVNFSDGTPFQSAPRTVLKNVISDLAKDGLVGNVRAEMEFFFLDPDEHAPADNVGYMDISAGDKHAPIRRRIATWMQEMGMAPHTIHHECGDAQHEIEFKMDGPLKMADDVQAFKLMTGFAAIQAGLRHTFMPKPFTGKAGSGLHVHQFLSKDGRSIFGDLGGLTDDVHHYIAGLLHYAPETVAVTNASVNSFKRLVVGHEAPVYLTWGIGNRTAAVRVPGYEDNVRVEYRIADPAGNIYYSLALMLAAGHAGIKEKLQPPDESTENLGKHSLDELKSMGIAVLPRNLEKAIDILETSKFARSILGTSFMDFHITESRANWNDFMKCTGENDDPLSVSQWEVQKYLNV